MAIPPPRGDDQPRNDHKPVPVQPRGWRALGPRGWKWLAGAVSAAVIAAISAVTVNLVTSHVEEVTGSASPLTLKIDVNTSDFDGCRPYLLGTQPAAMPNPPTDVETQSEMQAWWARQGAVDADYTHVQITAQGRSAKAVVLTALKVRVLQRKTPAQGTVYSMTGCGGAQEVRPFSVNLDRGKPAAHAEPGEKTDPGTGELRPAPPVRFPYRVSESDPEVFLVTASTKHCDCSWEMSIRWTSDGKAGEMFITDQGRPFRTSAAHGLRKYGYNGDDGWQPSS